MSAFKATKKPVTIEALLWDGGNLKEVEDFVGEKFDNLPVGYNFVAHKANTFMSFECSSSKLFVQTFEGEMEVSIGDYIIKDVLGEFYPCKPDIFEATYDYQIKEKVLYERRV